MGQSSEMYIETHNERMATDEDYAKGYEESMLIDAALEAEFFARELMLEKFEDFFDDKLIDFRGEIIQLSDTNVAQLIDDDLPF